MRTFELNPPEKPFGVYHDQGDPEDSGYDEFDTLEEARAFIADPDNYYRRYGAGMYLLRFLEVSAPAPGRLEGKCACCVDPLRWNKRRKCWLPPLETYDLLPGTHCHKCGAYLCRGVAIPHPMSREALEAAAKAAEEAKTDAEH